MWKIQEIRKFNGIECEVFYPSKGKEKRGNIPYVEYDVNGVLWRAHFVLPAEHRYDQKPFLRPTSFLAKVTRGKHHLYLWCGRALEVEIKSKQVVSTRTSTK